jgi:mannose-6-phosphate isomerase-like protein (cupin superfamily)
MKMEILSYEFNGEGMNRVYENEKWAIALENWELGNDQTSIDFLKRHNGTDKLFVLLSGECVLVFANEEEDELTIEAVKMEHNKVYHIPKSLWHNMITKNNTKLLLIKDSSASMRKSDILPLTDRQMQEIQELANCDCQLV